MVEHACSNVDVLFKALTAKASDAEVTYPADAEASVPMHADPHVATAERRDLV